MSAPAVSQALLRILVWLSAYAAMVVARASLERWLVGRFQGSSRTVLPVLTPVPDGGIALRAMAIVAGVVCGAFIPLAPVIGVAGLQIELHLFGEVEAGVLLSLGALWVSVCLLAFDGSDSCPSGVPRRSLAAQTLLGALPATAVVLSLLITGNAMEVDRAPSAGLAALIESQGRWQGLRWLCVLQPLAAVLWISSAVALVPGARQRSSLAWQVAALSHTLLTAAILLGGWQGPFVRQVGWLGLLYTALKVAGLACLHVWLQASLPRGSIAHTARTVWTRYVPLAVLNLVLTAGIVALH